VRAARFIDPDTGRECFAEYRDGGGRDAGTAYASDDLPPVGRQYRTGVTITCEADEGKVLQSTAADVVGLRAHDQWSNQGGTYGLAVTTIGASVTVAVTSGQGRSLPRGRVRVHAAPALEGTGLRATGFGSGSHGMRATWLVGTRVVGRSVGEVWHAPLAVVGKRVRARVTVYGRGRRPRTVTTSGVRIPPATIYYTGTPSRVGLLGKPSVGATLRVRSMTWVGYDLLPPPGLRVRHVWLRNGRVLPGATGRSYRLRASDRGTTISVVELVTAPKFRKGTGSRSPGRRIR
jgi:hypothetical protein